MDTARIAELLTPFVRARHPEPEQAEPPNAEVRNAGKARPERSREEAAVLSPTQLQHISTYIDILLRWNARINLTAIRDPEEIVTRHFGESLLAARYLFPGSSSVTPVSPVVKAVADVGSGAGFPGLPIKLWAPQISLTLIESNHKKVAFLREVTRALTLTDVNIQNTRAETITDTFDVVTLRAVERFDQILPTAAALVAPSGRLALLISAAQRDEAIAILPEYAWSAPSPIPHSRSRILIVGTSSKG
jgi:16S rRNA (guanine527-N7)-methyltransferase